MAEHPNSNKNPSKLHRDLGTGGIYPALIYGLFDRSRASKCFKAFTLSSYMPVGNIDHSHGIGTYWLYIFLVYKVRMFSLDRTATRNGK